MNPKPFDEGHDSRDRYDVFNGPSHNPYDECGSPEESSAHRDWDRGFRQRSRELYPEFYDD